MGQEGQRTPDMLLIGKASFVATRHHDLGAESGHGAGEA
jgi:hypothetical protein